MMVDINHQKIVLYEIMDEEEINETFEFILNNHILEKNLNKLFSHSYFFLSKVRNFYIYFL